MRKLNKAELDIISAYSGLLNLYAIVSNPNAHNAMKWMNMQNPNWIRLKVRAVKGLDECLVLDTHFPSDADVDSFYITVIYPNGKEYQIAEDISPA